MNSETKVLITCQCSDKILSYDELVHEGCVIMMFMNQFIVTQNFSTALTGDKYFSKMNSKTLYFHFIIDVQYQKVFE